MSWFTRLFKRQAVETRASGSGFTAELIGARAAYIQGRSGGAELSGTVAGATALWEAAFASADVTGRADALAPCDGSGGP